jgi:hypothetical protein
MRLKGGTKKIGVLHRRAVELLLFFVFCFFSCRSETVWFGRLETLCRPPAWKNSGIQYDSSAQLPYNTRCCFVLFLSFHHLGIFFKRSCASFCVVASLHIVTIPKRGGVSVYSDGYGEASREYIYTQCCDEVGRC